MGGFSIEPAGAGRLAACGELGFDTAAAALAAGLRLIRPGAKSENITPSINQPRHVHTGSRKPCSAMSAFSATNSAAPISGKMPATG
jgi:hypothetical protein